jgi:NADH-quinone oxidoreductase subunit A
MQAIFLPIFLLAACVAGLAVGLLVLGVAFGPRRPGRVKQMPYESGMDPIHDARRRFDVRFHLVAIAFLVFDVELLFLYPWAVATRPAQVPDAVPAVAAPVGIDAAVARGPTRGYVASRDLVFAGAMLFVALLALGLVYDWRKGVFQWR